jgi:cytochrome c oxidase assembly protein subunit 15
VTGERGSRADRAVLAWLATVWLMVLAIVVVGGITRLTGSGLSMVVWEPLIGAVPPLREADWLAVFEQYKRTPQYAQVNSWMTLADFQRIFFWEYLHRLLGRSIGVVVMVPGLWFLARGRLHGRTALRVLLAFVFGGLQGALGWYMVKSGLVDVPAVSHYRLAAHLSLAFFVGVWVQLLLLDLLAPPSRRGDARVRRGAAAFLVLLSLQIVYGAFMAGSRAGYLFSTWPDMNGSWWPPGATLAWSEVTSNVVSIHALHRHLAWLVLAAGLALAARARRAAADRGQGRSATALASALVLQFLLGIAAVTSGVSIVLASAHQGVAFLLLCSSVWMWHAFRDRITPPRREDR